MLADWLAVLAPGVVLLLVFSSRLLRGAAALRASSSTAKGLK